MVKQEAGRLSQWRGLNKIEALHEELSKNFLKRLLKDKELAHMRYLFLLLKYTMKL